MSTYFNGSNSNTYSSYYGPGGSVTIGAGVEIGNLGEFAAISMAGAGVVVNLGSIVGGGDAIFLGDGGMVTNGSATNMSAQVYGGIVVHGAEGTVDNFSQVYGSNSAIYLALGGDVINGNLDNYSAYIVSTKYGVQLSGLGTITNFGRIFAEDRDNHSYIVGNGIFDKDGDLYIQNGNSKDEAIIDGGKRGIYSARAEIDNFGEIKGSVQGIDIVDSAIIHNYGTVEGGTGIYSALGSLSIYNSGTIYGSDYLSSNDEQGIFPAAVVIGEGTKEFIKNSIDGLIEGNFAGVETALNSAITLINYGTIETSNSIFDDAVSFSLGPNLLVVEAGSKMIGQVFGGWGTLELGAQGGPGTTSGGYSDFSEYLVPSGADWTLAHLGNVPGSVVDDYGSLTVTGLITIAGSLDVTGTFVDAGAGTATASGVVTNDGLLEIDQDGLLNIAGTLTGDGTIEVSNHSTLYISGQSLSMSGPMVNALVDFADDTGTLSLVPDPLGLGVRIEGFGQGDVIDLPGISDTGTASLSYANGLLSIVENGALAAELSLTNVPEGAVFGLQGDHHGGIEVVIWSVPNVLPAAQLGTLENGIIALGRDVAETQGVTDPSLNVFTPQALLNPSGSRVKGDINLADGKPTAVGETITLAAKVQGIVLTGQHRSAEIIGHAANTYAASELLVGNNGNDTILGGGGSGTIIAGSGQNQIETGSGNMLVSSSGTDQIDTGSGDDTVYAGGVAWVTAQGNATVHGGAGFTTFTDAGTASSADKVKGGSGTTIMNSGIGLDTFVGGAGTSFMNDTGPGRVALVFNKGTGGTDIVTGFDPGNGDYIRATAASNGWNDFQDSITVIGGSSFVHLADGTKIEFVGFTSLTAADFQA